MRVIGVLDLVGGQAVHARAGRREDYAPIETVAGQSIEPGNALALAEAYVDRLSLTELYVADLDAIRGQGSQDALISRLSDFGVTLWLDAGVSSAAQARHTLKLGASHVVVGLETLSSFKALEEVTDVVGPDQVTFSLDLRNGTPVIAAQAHRSLRGTPPHRLAARAAQAGASSVIVIDLARVGTSQGIDLDLMSGVRNALGEITLLAGGGVRGCEDLAQISIAGCDGALVASALHDGRLDAAAIADARRL
jgi:phosphoribosylformimino-5-aminoimidazole carboxamide ribotide isomerase